MASQVRHGERRHGSLRDVRLAQWLARPLPFEVFINHRRRFIVEPQQKSCADFCSLEAAQEKGIPSPLCCIGLRPSALFS